MASASSTNISLESIPQWKKDLIHRRRQQTKVLANNGASVKLCTAVIGAVSGVELRDDRSAPVCDQVCIGSLPNSDRCGDGSCSACDGTDNNHSGSNSLATTDAGARFCSDNPCKMSNTHCLDPSTVHSGGTTSSATVGSSCQSQLPCAVTSNMHLGTDCVGLDSDGVFNSTDTMIDQRNKLSDIVNNLRSSKSDLDMSMHNKPLDEDDGSDSSEELQYGPGIVNKLKSKYINLTLRETNRSRQGVSNFRRSTSLEDLLDCDNHSIDKYARTSAKRNVPGFSSKTDRYRNASGGNDSMKRARSVETLLRYNAALEDTIPHSVPSRFTASFPQSNQANDRIILINQTSVRIENKLIDLDRPKPLNKPKRVKLVVDETERPPPDLVKTTLRIFESTTKRLKPKGDVAAKVATFKTINDTFKTPNQKRIPKPPLQQKPLVNRVKRPNSPKKITSPQPSGEKFEHSEHHNNGVIEPITQSVSSVVTKFQQIEKSLSPSLSPEPLGKFKFSSILSSEPPCINVKVSPECKMKSSSSVMDHKLVPTTKTLSPSLPLVSSQKTDCIQQNSMADHKLSQTTSETDSIKQSPMPGLEDDSCCHQDSTMESVQNLQSSCELPPQEVCSEREKSPDISHHETSRSPYPFSNDTNGEETVDGIRNISKIALENIGKAGMTMKFSFNFASSSVKTYLPNPKPNFGQTNVIDTFAESDADTEHREANVNTKQESKTEGLLVITKSSLTESVCNISTTNGASESSSKLVDQFDPKNDHMKGGIEIDDCVASAVIIEVEPNATVKSVATSSSLPVLKTVASATSLGHNTEPSMKVHKTEALVSPQKQVGVIRPLVSTKTQVPQLNLSNREMEKNLINRVKSIEPPTKVVLSLKSAKEIQPVKKNVPSNSGGLWDTKPWNDQNNTMVFNFSNRKEVPDYIENDGLRVRRKRSKPKVTDESIIIVDATLDASTTDESEWEMSGGPPSPCNVSFLNDNILINGRSNLSKQPRNHRLRIQFDDAATRTFEYPSETSMLEGESSNLDTETSVQRTNALLDSTAARSSSANSTSSIPSILGGSGLASYIPSKVDLASEGFELGVTRVSASTPATTPAHGQQSEICDEDEYLKPAQDAAAWGLETTADLLF